MKTVLISLALATGLGLCACNGGNSEKHEDTVDSAKDVNKAVKPVQADASNFAVEAANGGMMEVLLGKVAQENASSARVRAFGEMMVKDHTEAGNKLKDIASSLNIALPDSVSDDSRKEIDKLKKKKGKDFDKAYVDLMVKDHKDDIDDFKKEAEKGNDSTVSKWAKNTLPVLEHHLMMSEDVQKNLEK